MSLHGTKRWLQISRSWRGSGPPLCHEDFIWGIFMICRAASCQGRGEMACKSSYTGNLNPWFHVWHNSSYSSFYRCYDEHQ